MNPFETQIEELKDEPKVEEQKVELNVLPSHLKYVFLGDNSTKPVIINNSLSSKEEHRLKEVLIKNQEAMIATLRVYKSDNCKCTVVSCSFKDIESTGTMNRSTVI